MKRNLLLFLAVLVGIIFIVNSTKRILTFRDTSKSVEDAQKQLDRLREENKILENELEYKKTDEFAEKEIRDKLGLAREGETIVVLPKEDNNGQQETSVTKSQKNWQKWWELFFGG